MIYPVILAGGSGTRVWPVSHTDCPKPFTHGLLGPSHPTLFQATLTRLAGLLCHPATVVCHHSHYSLAAPQADELNYAIGSWILETSPRNTGPAILLAALHLQAQDADATLLILPTDHVIDEEQAFHTLVTQALPLAEQGKIVTFGIPPTHPTPQYGYIIAQDTRVTHFIEKPPLPQAADLIAQGAFWNSGMFLARAATLIAEASLHHPQLLQQARQCLATIPLHHEVLRLTEEASHTLPDISFDHAIAHPSQQLVMLPLTAGWHDLGSWHSLWEYQPKDGNGNHASGPITLSHCTNSYLQSDTLPLIASDLHDTVVVAHQGKLLVSSRTGSTSLPAPPPSPSLIHRPWGFYHQLTDQPNFKVKQLTVYPGAMLSLQRHHHRAEHWIIVAGEATVTCNDHRFSLPAHASTFIPAGATHRLANLTTQLLIVIEVQTGSSLDENDIERFDDLYGRSLQAIQA